MSARPWMPFYIADYLADTQHLNAIEHGVYFLLLLHHWQHGSLPNDEVLLQRIARFDGHANASAKEMQWANVWRNIAPFFKTAFENDRHVLKQKRLVTELAKAFDISAKRRDAAFQRHGKKHANADAIADANDMQNSANGYTRARVPQPQPQPEPQPLPESTFTKEVVERTNSVAARDNPGGEVSKGFVRSDPSDVKKKLGEDWPSNYREIFAELFPPGTALMPGLEELEATRQAGEVSWAVITEGIANYAAALPADRFPMNPAKWLRERRYLDRPARRGSSDVERARDLARRAEITSEGANTVGATPQTVGSDEVGRADVGFVPSNYRARS